MKYPESESSTLEFKESIPKNNQIIKTIIGFCNQYGGKLIIGVENDGTIKGLSKEELERSLEYLDQNIYEKTSPHIIPLIYTQTIGGKVLLIIEVASGMNRPYHVRFEPIEKTTYIRLGRSTLLATPDIIEELSWQSRGLSYDSMAMHLAKPDDLDEEKIKHFFRNRKNSSEVPADFLKALAAYDITTDEHGHWYPTVAGILLFGKNPQKFFTEAFIICSRFAGIEGREALATRDCTGTLFEQCEEAVSFVASRLNYSFKITGIKREDKLELPLDAVREAIINALIHRNYHIKAPLKITIYDNRIEIFSPGGFPGPLNPKNLKMGLTYTRNPALAKIFREAGYGEKLGTGLITIFSLYEKWGLKEPEILEGENFVKYILPRAGNRRKALPVGIDEEKQILNLFETSTELTITDIISALDIPRSTLGRKLQALEKKGLIAKVGVGRATRYVLKHSSS